MTRMKTFGVLFALLLFSIPMFGMLFFSSPEVSATENTGTISQNAPIMTPTASTTLSPSTQPTSSTTDAQLVQPVNTTITITATHSLFGGFDDWLASWIVPGRVNTVTVSITPTVTATGSITPTLATATVSPTPTLTATPGTTVTPTTPTISAPSPTTTNNTVTINTNAPTIFLDNESNTTFTVQNPSIVLVGSSTSTTVDTQVRLQQCPNPPSACDVTITLPAHQVTHIPLTIDAGNLPPDHYLGSIRFYLQGTTTTITVNLDLSVRYGPFWPLIIIFLGIIFGRAAIQMTTPLALKQIDLLPRYYSLRQEIFALPFRYTSRDENIATDLNNAKKALHDHLITLHTDIESSDPAQTEDMVTQEANELETALNVFKSLAALKSEIEKEDPTNQDRTGYTTALSNLANWNIKDAQGYTHVQNIRLTHLNEETRGFLSISSAGYLGYDRQALQSIVRRKTPPGKAFAKGFAKFSRKSAAFLSWLTGHPLPDAELRYWFGRPLLELLLLILLPMIGLQTLYVNGSATFGVAGFYDFLTLFLWGLSADIAQRSLQNLPIGIGLPSASNPPSPAPQGNGNVPQTPVTSPTPTATPAPTTSPPPTTTPPPMVTPPPTTTPPPT